MTRILAGILCILAAVLAGCASGPSAPASAPTGAGWITLIDGEKGMENWNVTNGGNWHAEDGAIVADRSTGKGSSVLVSRREFRDFELYAEFWAAPETNSGIYIRVRNPNQVSTSTGAYEAQIWDANPDRKFTSGSFAPNVAPVEPIHKVGGRWNVYEIRAKGPELSLTLNGVHTVTANDARFPEGRIGLQFNPNTGPIKFRKLMVREL